MGSYSFCLDFDSLLPRKIVAISKHFNGLLQGSTEIKFWAPD